MSIPPGNKIITRQSDGAGYLFSDNRAASEGVEEADIVCCPHCQCTINLQMWKKERSLGGGGWCRQCFSPVCGPCTTRMLQFGCEPFMKLVDEAMKRAYRIRRNRKIMDI